MEDKAVVFQKGNISDLKENLQWLCDHPESVEKYKEAASDFICGKYNWDDVVGKTIVIYKGD